MKIRLVGGKHEYAFNLPVLNDNTNHPCVFRTKKSEDVKIQFTIYCLSTGPEQEELVDNGVGVLEDVKDTLGPGRESFIRDFAIPLLERQTLEFIGSVTFNVLVVKPFNNGSTTTTSSPDSNI